MDEVLSDGDGILKAIPEDFSLSGFSARLIFFSAAKLSVLCVGHAGDGGLRTLSWEGTAVLFPPLIHYTAHD